ncbi:hypothetical protein CPB85DRAFT_1284523 [Mucidula mucida]|nr:hypothetical protein CPB85DRAFT_1284523 [Mucidula mucida]
MLSFSMRTDRCVLQHKLVHHRLSFAPRRSSYITASPSAESFPLCSLLANNRPVAMIFEQPDVRYVIIFNTVNIVALVLLVAIFSTALLFRSRIRRCSLWYMFISSWIVYTVGNTLLLGHQTGPPDGIPHGLCFAQAIMVYTTPSLTAYCTLALLIQLSFHVSALVRPSGICESPCIKNLHYLPVIPVLVSLIMTLVVGIRHPDFLQRSSTGMNCDLQVDTLRYLCVIFVVAALVGALGFIGTEASVQERLLMIVQSQFTSLFCYTDIGAHYANSDFGRTFFLCP